MEELVQQAANNPYLIIAGFILAVLSALQPIARLSKGAASISRTMYQRGVTAPISQLKESAQKRTFQLIENPGRANTYILANIYNTLYSGILSVIGIMFGLLFLYGSTQTEIYTFGIALKIIAIIYIMPFGLTLLITLLQSMGQAIIAVRYRSMIIDKMDDEA